MPTAIDSRVTPTLHAETLKALDGFDDSTMPYIAPAIEALDDAYITLGKLHDGRDAAKKNQAWTEGQQVLAVSETANRHQQRLLKKFDGLVSTMDKQIAKFEEELSQPLESRAAVTIAGEVRKFVKSLSVEERHKFLQQAIDDGDAITCSSVLGAPSYLSGLDAGMSKSYTRLWHEKMNPQASQRLKVIRGAKTHIEKSGALVVEQIEKAMGAKWATVNELRQGNDKALAALKFGDGQ
jgi:hypothetical protein